MGSSMSTTIMGLLGTNSQQSAKRKVAMSHFIFNLSTTLIVTLLYPYLKDGLIRLLDNKSENNLFMLSAFHSLFNLILVVVWTPLL